LGLQDTGDTDNIGHTRHRRHWQHWAYKTQEPLAILGTQDKQTLEKTEGTIKNGQSRDIGNIEHTRHSRDTH
jgi:hypothetical protein